MTERQIRLYFGEAEKLAAEQQANQIDAMSLSFSGQPSDVAKQIRGK